MKIQGKILFRISTITILFCFIISSNKAQYTSANVTTPKGSTVTAYTATEQSTFWRNYWDNAYAASGRSFVDYFSDGYSSSQRYNDIGYAWHMVEGGAARAIGYTSYNESDGDVYRTDGSYIEVCSETYPGKVRSVPGAGATNNGVTTSTSGVWMMKIGPLGPLMISPSSDNLYSGGTIHYYVSTMISGSASDLCSGTRTFSVPSASGASYSWTYNSTKLTATTGTTSNTFTVQQNGSNHGWAYVDCTISTSCSSSISTRLYFTVGKPEATDSYLALYDGTSGTWNTICTEVDQVYTVNTTPGSSAAWSLVSASPSGGVTYSTIAYDGDGVYNDLDLYMYKLNQVAILSLGVTNSCGTESYNYAFNAQACGGRAFSVAPNPATSDIVIKSNSSDTKIKEIRLADKMGQVKKRIIFNNDVSTFSINISSLPSDVYFMLIYDGKTWVSRQVIKK